ncbi:putative Polyprotein [Cinnamomum micranthum f. kanehirae]|uniref:Putative Polyprotein n=1 Tax=Cinnamomum micranthum f. kanehirae TaxID=337451 RepID=A0A443P300_9MAGN|nr:putative Polyprotein [Cinnamomum micranthum f. kanehirae]
MIENGYKSNESDKCIYYKSWENSHAIVSLYVDDLLIFGSNLHVINETKNMLCSYFDMKDLGEANFILGMKITKSCDGIFLDQSHYVEKILKKYNYNDCKHVVTPFDSSTHLFPVENDNDVINQKEYASIIGSLRFATDCTRPDIAYAVGVLSRFTSKPGRDHWHAIERVMKYLFGTKNYGLFYKKYPAVLEGFSDADWNTLSGDSLSTTGYIFTLGGGAICWKSKKQTIIANSTMEAELIALASASEEANWLRDLLHEIPLWEKPVPPVLIHCDSTAAIARVQNRYYNGHTIPLLHLVHLLHNRNIIVTIFTTPANSSFIRSSLTHTTVTVFELPFPQSPPNIPSGVESTDKLPSMSLSLPFVHATKLLQPYF